MEGIGVCVYVWGGRRGGRVCCVRCGFVLVGKAAIKPQNKTKKTKKTLTPPP